MPKVFIGADHGGFELKEKIKSHLTSRGYQVEDCGAFALDPDDDYPSFAFKVAQGVAQDPYARGVLLCRSGVGMTIAANKVAGARAATLHTPEEAAHARSHDAITIAALPADFLREEEIFEVLGIYLVTPFSDQPRHKRRLQQISDFEAKNI
jgi:ribose 5-phosphate isomerase B